MTALELQVVPHNTTRPITAASTLRLYSTSFLRFSKHSYYYI